LIKKEERVRGIKYAIYSRKKRHQMSYNALEMSFNPLSASDVNSRHDAAGKINKNVFERGDFSERSLALKGLILIIPKILTHAVRCRIFR